MPYVDGYLLAVKKKNVPAYRRLALKAAKIWREHGALEVRECIGDHLDTKYGTPYPRLIKTKRDETVIFSWIVFKSRAHRDKVNAKVIADPRLTGMDMNSMPFDPKRMSFGGFAVLVAA